MASGTLVVAVVGLLDFAQSVLLVVHEPPRVDAAVFVEVLSFPLLLVLVPVSDVEFSFLVVVLAFAVLHAFVEVALVSLGVGIFHAAATVGLAVQHFTVVLSSIRQF